MRHVTEVRPGLIKLDAGLVRGLHDSSTQQAFLRAIAAFVAEVGATVIAEGVEDQDDLELLARGDTAILVQGFAIARPGPPWPSPLLPARAMEAEPVAAAPRGPGHLRHRPSGAAVPAYTSLPMGDW